MMHASSRFAAYDEIVRDRRQRWLSQRALKRMPVSLNRTRHLKVDLDGSANLAYKGSYDTSDADVSTLPASIENPKTIIISMLQGELSKASLQQTREVVSAGT